MKIQFAGLIQRFAFCAGIAVALSGCVHLKQRLPVRVPLPLPDVLQAQISYTNHVPRVLHSQLVFVGDTFKVYFFYLESFVPEYGTNKVLTLESWIPNDATNADSVLDLPVSAGKEYPLERWFLGEHFAHLGYVFILLHREDYKGVDPEDHPELLNLAFAQSIRDECRVIDWIQTRSECNPKHIASIGISMGAIKNALLGAVEPRVRASVLVLGGADIASILAHSKEGSWQTQPSIKKKERQPWWVWDRPHKKVEINPYLCRGITARREKYMEKHHMTRAQFEQWVRDANIVWDPKNIGKYADPSKFCIIGGFCDNVVPFRNGMILRKEYGYPDTHILPVGHYTSALLLWYIEDVAHKFFQEKFKEVR